MATPTFVFFLFFLFFLFFNDADLPSFKIVELLLQKRAVTNAATRDQKWTPLHFCAYYDNQEALKILLGDSNNHPDVNAKDVRGRTPAFMAAMGDQLACLELLKASGADLTINDFSANTPLAFAAARGNKAVASYLIAQLKPNFPPVIVTKPIATPSQRRSGDVLEEPPYYNKDSFGQTLLHLAVRAGEVHLVRKLLHNNIKDPATVDSWLEYVMSSIYSLGYKLTVAAQSCRC
jgi:ankyrin repeat protein